MFDIHIEHLVSIQSIHSIHHKYKFYKDFPMIGGEFFDDWRQIRTIVGVAIIFLWTSKNSCSILWLSGGKGQGTPNKIAV